MRARQGKPKWKVQWKGATRRGKPFISLGLKGQGAVVVTVKETSNLLLEAQAISRRMKSTYTAIYREESRNINSPALFFSHQHPPWLNPKGRQREGAHWSHSQRSAFQDAEQNGERLRLDLKGQLQDTQYTISSAHPIQDSRLRLVWGEDMRTPEGSGWQRWSMGIRFWLSSHCRTNSICCKPEATNRKSSKARTSYDSVDNTVNFMSDSFIHLVIHSRLLKLSTIDVLSQVILCFVWHLVWYQLGWQSDLDTCHSSSSRLAWACSHDRKRASSHKRLSLNAQVFFKPLFASHLLMSCWTKQVT